MLVEKLGPVKKCKINLGQETILLGRNNSGKTYISYLLYGIYKRINKSKGIFLEAFLKEIIEKRNSYSVHIDKSELFNYVKEKILMDLNENLIKDLPSIFNVGNEEFSDTKITITDADFNDFLSVQQYPVLNIEDEEVIDEVTIRSFKSFTLIKTIEKHNEWIISLEEIGKYSDNIDIEEEEDRNKRINGDLMRGARIYLSDKIFSIPNILYIPAERNGINVFRKELLINRGSQTFDINADIKYTEKYPLPISDYMKYLSVIDLERAETFLLKNSRMHIWNKFSKDILKGKYEFDATLNEYYYREVYSSKDEVIKYKTKKIPLQISSSSIKSLFGMEYYIKYLFKKGDILFIDEPEMNLDPENQLKFAELLVELSNYGVKIIVSSHSDYLIRSTTNKILSAKVNDEKLNGKIVGYYFEEGIIKEIGDLAAVDYLDIFDNPNSKLEEEYFRLVDEIENKSK